MIASNHKGAAVATFYPVEIKASSNGGRMAIMLDLPDIVGRGATGEAAFKDLAVLVMPILDKLYVDGTLPSASAANGRRCITFSSPVKNKTGC